MRKSLILIIGCILFIVSCRTTTLSIPNAEYYDKLANNHERIFRLLTGNYSYYEADTLATFNEELDSMVLYIVGAGLPARDGYWIYSEQYLTSLPDGPLLQSLQLIERVSRDTFKGKSYVLTPEGKELYIGLSKTPDAPQLKEPPKEVVNADGGDECPIIYIKQSNNKFIMKSDTCLGMAEAGFSFMQLQGTVELTGQDASMIFLDENKDSIRVSEAFFRRLPPEASKKKK